jgi:hypothetical protein
MLGLENNTEILLSVVNKQASAGTVMSLADALLSNSDSLPDKFELRINEEWLMSLNLIEYGMVFSFMTDLDMISPLIQHTIIKEFDQKEKQHVYKFIRIKYNENSCQI